MGARAPTTDAEIAVADEDRLTAIVREHFDLLWRFVHRVGLSGSDVDDAVQEVIVVLARKLHQVKVGSERAFLLATAYRIGSDLRRRRRRWKETDDAVLWGLESPDHNPEESLAQKRLQALLQRALDQLPVELRAVFVLYEVEELTMAEIATTLALPLGTVASRLRRARSSFEELAEAAVSEGISK